MFFLFFFSADQRKFVLYFFRIAFSIFFSFIFFFFPLKQLLKQLSHFFFTTTFRSKIRFFSFCRFIFFLFSVFVTQNLIRKSLIHVFILKELILKPFHRFFLSRKFFLSNFFFIVSIFFFRSLSLFWCLKFSVVRCFFSIFELYDFDRKHSNLMFFHAVVFFEKKIRQFVFLFFANVVLLWNSSIFCSIRSFFFSIYLQNFSIRSSMWKNEMCVRKNWWWIKNK